MYYQEINLLMFPNSLNQEDAGILFVLLGGSKAHIMEKRDSLYEETGGSFTC